MYIFVYIYICYMYNLDPWKLKLWTLDKVSDLYCVVLALCLN